jgi:alkylation response protein AidB-like acyl-CoA dehydrogenase
MKLDNDPEIEHFRAEVRRFIETNRPAMTAEKTVRKTGVRAPDAGDIPALRTWTGQLFDAGYFGGDWPAEWGGKGAADPLRATVVGGGMARARVPAPIGAGLLAAMALIHYGRHDQKERYLPRIRAGQDIWCQLFSEPGAGSDLASLATRATRVKGDSGGGKGRWAGGGDTFVIDGQKVWTTVAQHAELGYLLARTDPAAEKHAGITAFVVDMKSSGIEVRPLREITGTYDFNEVFFDGVRVPAENVIGAVGQGWQVATTSLAHERSSVGTAGVAMIQAVSDAVDMARTLQRSGRPALRSDEVRQTLARLYAAARVITVLGHYNLSRTLHGTADAADAPLAKILFSETNLALAEFGLSIQGTASLLTGDDPDAIADGWWQDAFLYARAYTIAGGANEVLRTMAAERAMGLPREPKGA